MEFKFGENNVNIIAVDNIKTDVKTKHYAIIKAENEVEKQYLKHEIIDLVSLNCGYNPLSCEIVERSAKQTLPNKYLLMWITKER